MGGNVEGEIAVIPFEVFAGGVEQVLVGNEEITYPALGVNAIDLANMVGMSEELTQGSQVGALLHGDVAVETGSSAQEAGLQEGDIILSIDGVSVNSENALADLVLLYQEGDTVSIELQRNGERADVQVTLGALSL
jgi:putative serine protease PepD